MVYILGHVFFSHFRGIYFIKISIIAKLCRLWLSFIKMCYKYSQKQTLKKNKVLFIVNIHNFLEDRFVYYVLFVYQNVCGN